MSIPILNDKPEILSATELFDSKKMKKHQGTDSNDFVITIKDNLYEVRNQKGQMLVSYSKTDDKNSTFFGYDYFLNPLIGILKEFYPNKILKTKGLYYWYGFKIGKWYNYNEKGTLISSDNFDDGFDFTYEMVFSYCRDNKIPLEKKEDEIEQQLQSMLLLIESCTYGG